MAFRNAQHWLVGASIALGLTLPTVAHAQQPIPTGVISKSGNLSPSEETVVRQWVAAHAPGLNSDDPQVRSASRKALQLPLLGTSQSDAPAPSFRFIYTSELVVHLDRLVRTGDPRKIIDALHLAGRIATERSTQLPVLHLGHEDVGVRYAAARAVGLTFGSLNTSAPAVRNVPALINALGQRLLTEEEPLVLDRLIQTLTVAVNFQNPAVASNRLPAIDQITQNIGRRLQRLEPDKNNVQRLQMLLRALEVVERSFLQGVFVGAPNIGRDPAIINAAGLGGDAMTYVAKRVKGGIDKAEERELLIKMAVSAETIIFFTASQHTQGRGTPNPSVAGLLQAGRDNEYLEQLKARYTEKPDGVLVSPPFNLDPARFAF